MNAVDIDTSNGQGVNCPHLPQMVRGLIVPIHVNQSNLPLPSSLNCYAGIEEPPPLPTSAIPNAHTRSYWRWSKQDFFPEPSFQSFTTYRAALASACPRLKDCLLSCFSDNNELNVLSHASENLMRRCLTAWDLTWLDFGSIIGSRIFVITGQEARTDAGPTIVLAYAISNFSALCYTEFAVDVPVVGGSFSFLCIKLDDFIAFLATENILLKAVVGTASLGHSRTRNISTLNWLSSIVTTLVIVFIIVVGLVYGKTSNLTPFFPMGMKGVFNAAAIVYWSYTGFDIVETMAEDGGGWLEMAEVGGGGGSSIPA
ncbi:cationic amino acid transporter 8, vacuolar-like [Arachis stenosperma]|uniref:cationic amino acid transporter 8, vacuolar-like n=1 Tax=Arachis stenosperma TaxID=217475 RepID=UPI0025AC19D2|nr:cationic amino acid transporter 8, vacuolar-like [Arachis stenosperma]